MIDQENFEAHKQLVLEDYEREVQGKSGGLSYWYYVQSAKGMIESFEQLQAENAALRERLDKLDAVVSAAKTIKPSTLENDLINLGLALQALEEESGAGK